MYFSGGIVKEWLLMPNEFRYLTKYHVWDRSYSSDRRFRRWQQIMRRASRMSKLPNGQGYLEIDGQRSFRCELCDQFADFADYESLNLFCLEHAIWYLKINGMTPVFNGRIKESV